MTTDEKARAIVRHRLEEAHSQAHTIDRRLVKGWLWRDLEREPSARELASGEDEYDTWNGVRAWES